MGKQDGDRMPPEPDAARRAMAATLLAIGNLKHTLRTGWVDRGVPTEAVESVADHSFRVALMAWMLAMSDEASVDPARVLLIALAHDLPEALTGDPTPYAPDDIPEDDEVARRAFLDRRQDRSPERSAAKQRAEAAAMNRLLEGLDASVAEPLIAAWAEYEARTTPEARLVRQADKLETWVQSREYLLVDPSLPMTSFALQIADPATLPDARLVALRDALADALADAGSAGDGERDGEPDDRDNACSVGK